MADILSPIKTAIELAQKLKSVSDKIRDAELRNLIGDLSLQLAEIKIQQADLLLENADLKTKLQAASNPEGEPCPSCRKKTWVVVSSNRHPMLGDLGAINRKYRCSACGFEEVKLDVPKG